MDKFNLKEYISNNPLLKEEVMVNPIIMFGGEEYIKGVITSPDDYGFFEDDAEWIKSNILTAPKMISIQDYMNLDGGWIKQAQIETGGGGDIDHIVDALDDHVEKGLITPAEKAEAMKIVGLAYEDDGEYEEIFTPNPDDITMMSDEDEELDENEQSLKEDSGLLGPGGTFDKIDMDIMNIEESEKLDYLQNVIGYATEVMGDINDGSYYGLSGKK